MKMSQVVFTPEKNPPANADTINHRLLVQAGFVRQLMAGVYTYTPLGLAVLRKIENIIREKMNEIGYAEIHMPALNPSANWQTTGGWDKIDVLFKIKSRTGKEYALAQSHEEIVTPLIQEVTHSYKDLPKKVFQIQWKFRDELRAKSGILRGREFLMKDAYSFHLDQADFEKAYEVVKKAYLEIFSALNLDAKVTEASGGNFAEKISYEFMVLTDAGEDDIYYCPDCNYCINSEIATVEIENCPHCGAKLQPARASEAGNVFDLGGKFTRAFNFSVSTADNQKVYPVMGCYGIGVSRAMGIIAEVHHDDKGLLWPENVAPAKFYLIGLGEYQEQAAELYQRLREHGVDVIFDDRDASAGTKFAAADLIGCPYRIVISAKTEGKIELKKRGDENIQLVAEESLYD
ncbi:MAG: His/Gly/Thr/Pro-type tRNA ligase C-terminal domain-containing protein [bacterium]|nr:His/Gly/Thr/Pro-type tRNA ligase C-terminal domain-containing protein [bacterium]